MDLLKFGIWVFGFSLFAGTAFKIGRLIPAGYEPRSVIYFMVFVCCYGALQNVWIAMQWHNRNKAPATPGRHSKPNASR